MMHLKASKMHACILREGSCYQIGRVFGKVPKGGESFSIQKIMLQILGTLNRAFCAWNWCKKSEFRVQGMFLTIVSRKVKTRHTLKKVCACISYYLALIPPCIYSTTSIIKICNIIFWKWGGGGVEGHLEFSRKFIRFDSVTRYFVML